MFLYEGFLNFQHWQQQVFCQLWQTLLCLFCKMEAFVRRFGGKKKDTDRKVVLHILEGAAWHSSEHLKAEVLLGRGNNKEVWGHWYAPSSYMGSRTTVFDRLRGTP